MERISVGIHTEHNAGMAAVLGGRVVAYCEFERLTRQKNQAGWMPDIVGDMLESLDLSRIGAICTPDVEELRDLLRKRFGGTSVGVSEVVVDRNRIQIYGQDNLHPLFHILAALVLPEMRHGVYGVLVFDADQPRMGIVDLRGPVRALPAPRLRVVSSHRWFNGELYADFLGSLFYGGRDLRHCGKLMGLASWGRSRSDLVALLRELAQEAFDPSGRTWQGYSCHNRTAVLRRVRDGTGIDPRDHASAQTMHLAASGQDLFTDELLKQVCEGVSVLANDLREDGLPDFTGLIYGGGCALSVVSNSLIRSAIQTAVIAPPYAHDASQFVGAAVLADILSGDGPFPLGLGWAGIPSHSGGVVTQTQLTDLGLRTTPAVPAEIARRLASGQLIALAFGSSEAGPRALGNRSLIADPRDGAMRERLNDRVKRREWYRPFAPALPADAFPAYFGHSATTLSTYMLDCMHLRPEHRAELPAVVTADNSCRPQSVDAHRHPWFHDLLTAFGQLTGHPVLLNTSLNAPGRPIAYDLAQVMCDCNELGVDAAIVDGAVVERGQIAALAMRNRRSNSDV